MTNTIKMILFPVGAIVGGIAALVLKEAGVLSAEFDGRWMAVAMAIGGLLIGHYFDNKRECARIARELDEDRIKYEKQVK